TGQQVGNIIKEGFSNVYGNRVDYDMIGMGDGGEGRRDGLMDGRGGSKYRVMVNDGLMGGIEGCYGGGEEEKIGIIEMGGG
ncbi:glycerate kinase, partial [Staphylococcus aureus]|uniref:glycerate kinase n=1 Tax=Staphylococcus aureus TaxID=1280 RepID=UPI00164360A7